MKKPYKHYLSFVTVAEGEAMLGFYRALRNETAEAAHPVIDSYIKEIESQVNALRMTEKPRGIDVQPILDQYFAR